MLRASELLKSGRGWQKCHAWSDQGPWWQVAPGRTVEVSRTPDNVQRIGGVHVAPVDDILAVTLREVNG